MILALLASPFTARWDWIGLGVACAIAWLPIIWVVA